MIFINISDHYTSPAQYLFIAISSSINTLYGSIENITISTEATRIPTSATPYVTPNDSPFTISVIIKYLRNNLKAHTKETNEENIADQDEKFDAKL